MLQCGHGVAAVENRRVCAGGRHEQPGFNAATASPPWRTTISVRMHRGEEMLQCGHGVAAVENEVVIET